MKKVCIYIWQKVCMYRHKVYMYGKERKKNPDHSNNWTHMIKSGKPEPGFELAFLGRNYSGPQPISGIDHPDNTTPTTFFHAYMLKRTERAPSRARRPAKDSAALNDASTHASWNIWWLSSCLFFFSFPRGSFSLSLSSWLFLSLSSWLSLPLFLPFLSFPSSSVSLCPLLYFLLCPISLLVIVASMFKAIWMMW